ncbi:Protein abnormal spindle [Frankliniella fusca]|uniref:Protein abnormal spindle n=1 Tax=Frankliniella fusca TaxID=407009 RepID=A0AAE1L7T4_9NEOP|nr:Protein abnormal spindle [Frankliniella fusca]
MAHVFEISPPKRPTKSVSANEEPGCEVLYLAPFKPLPKIIFDNVKVNSKAKRLLIIRNPSTNKLSGELLNLPAVDRGFEFSFTSFDLAGAEEACLEITWVPTEAGSWRDTIPVRTTSKFKSDIIIVSSSINSQATKNVRKPVTSKSTAKPTVLAKKLVLSKPSSSKAATGRSVVQQHVHIAKSLPRTAISPCRRQTFLVNPENKENIPSVSLPTEKVKKFEPDISRRFEDFVMSPVNTNFNVLHVRNTAIDDLIMSPVVLAKPSVDFVDGDASANPKGIVPTFEEEGNLSQTDLRRATFDIGARPLQVTKNVSVDIPEIHLEAIGNSRDEFYDSLDEGHDSPTNCIQNKVSPCNSGYSIKMNGEQDYKKVACPEVYDSFMNSTIKFDLPLPSEDPRRCSTGVKVFPTHDCEGTESFTARKDLFQFMSGSPQQKQIDELFAVDLDVSQSADGIHGELPECTNACSNDRLSTSTYIKDRLSTGTYIKDRLSSETYTKEHHSRGSCSLNEDSCDEAAKPGHESMGMVFSPRSEDHQSFGKSPKKDDHLLHLKSPRPLLVSIEEEDVGGGAIDSEVPCHSYIKSTAFTVPLLDNPESKDLGEKMQAKFTGPKSPLSKRSPRNRRVIKVAPSLKKPITPPKSQVKPKSVQVKPGGLALRRQSIGGISKPTEKNYRRLSVSSIGSKPALSSRLPESKLSLSKNEPPVFKIPRGSKRIAQMQAAKSEVLHNLDDILAEVTNVDPFAASTSSDPFLNQAIYNDSSWIARQETDMIKWLNAMLTPPAELETNSDQVIDIGDLWQKTCRVKDVSLAPSRDEVSSDLYDQNDRLKTLRKSALTLIRSRDIASVLQKISVRVDQKVLSIRDDRDLHLDVGLQHQVLELLLAYNPLWLRIGLEAVYGRTVPLKSNSDYIGLTAFLVHNLLSDDHIVNTYSHPTVPYLKLPGFQQEMKKFILKKFLFIVFFLDRAKEGKLIGHDPCLFIRSAKVKDSRELVASFASDLLAGIGDVNRYLSSLGCKLTVKQTYLDEFEYAVKSLLDLRDGIRLVRVMELILSDHSLHHRLRVPPISRLQKVHNVDLALGALTAAGYELSGGITSKDIVDGHREKTLSLLWQIIYKFQGPRFAAAAQTLQRWWRLTSLPREIERRIRARKRARREAATVTLQAAWRGVLGRRRAAAAREEHARLQEARRGAAIVLQKHWRRRAAEEELRRARRAATRIARWYRGAVETRRLRQDFLHRRAAAVKIQAHCRGMLTRRRFADLRLMAAALRLQTWFRRRRTARLLELAAALARGWREERRRQDAACRVLQVRVRAWLAMRRARSRFQAVRAAVLVVQRRWRAQLAMHEERGRFETLRGAVLRVQNRWRARRAMRVQRAAYLSRRAAAVTLQGWVRARLQRRYFLRLRAAARLVQQRVRARWQARILRVDFLMTRIAVVKLQRAVRAWAAGRRDRARFLQLRAAALAVQRRFRCRAALRRLRRERLEKAVVSVQRRWRARRAARVARQEFLTLRGSTRVLQQRFRAVWSMWIERERFVRLGRATVLVQRRFRANRAMRQDRARYLSVKRSALTIQRQWRARVAVKTQRSEFLALRNAAIVIQCRFRAQLAMKKERQLYLQMQSASILIQKHFRAVMMMHRERDRYLSMQRSALSIQRQWRARVAMKTQRSEFLALRNAAIVIQCRFRAQLAMKKERQLYLQMQSASILIQKHFRAVMMMHRERDRYVSLRKAVITIQQRWRAKCAMKICRDEFTALYHAAYTIQTRYKAYRSMKHERSNYQQLRSAAVIIQRRFRANRLMCEERARYCQLQDATIFIQNRWRAQRSMVLQQKRYEELRRTVILIQRRWRSNQLTRQLSCKYLKIRSAALTIQRKWRAILQGRAEHQRYQVILASARLIQSTWRRRQLLLHQKAQYKALKCATVTLQKYIRGILARKRFRILREQQLRSNELYESSARVIQRTWRKWHKTQQDHKERAAAAIKIQACWRGHQSRKEFKEETTRLKELREQNNAAETQSINMKERICLLCVELDADTVGTVLCTLNALYTICMISPVLCEEMVYNDVVSKLFNLLCSINRGVADSEVALLTSKILVQLCKYEKTHEAVWQDGSYLNVFPHLMKKWISVDDKILLHFITMLWHFSQFPVKAEVILADGKLKSTIVFFLTKYKNRKSKSPALQGVLPSVTPNWGCIRKETRPFAFQDPLYGLRALCHKLKLKDNV